MSNPSKILGVVREENLVSQSPPQRETHENPPQQGNSRQRPIEPYWNPSTKLSNRNYHPSDGHKHRRDIYLRNHGPVRPLPPRGPHAQGHQKRGNSHGKQQRPTPERPPQTSVSNPQKQGPKAGTDSKNPSLAIAEMRDQLRDISLEYNAVDNTPTYDVDSIPVSSPKQLRQDCKTTNFGGKVQPYAPLAMFHFQNPFLGELYYNYTSLLTHPVYRDTPKHIDKRTLVVVGSHYLSLTQPSLVGCVALLFGPPGTCPHNQVAPIPKLALASGEADIWLVWKAMYEGLRLARMDPIEDIIILKVVILLPPAVFGRLRALQTAAEEREDLGLEPEREPELQPDKTKPWVFDMWREQHTEAVGTERIAVEWWPCADVKGGRYGTMLARQWAREGVEGPGGWAKWKAGPEPQVSENPDAVVSE